MGPQRISTANEEYTQAVPAAAEKSYIEKIEDGDLNPDEIDPVEEIEAERESLEVSE